jgi:hypothetical protein
MNTAVLGNGGEGGGGEVEGERKEGGESDLKITQGSIEGGDDDLSMTGGSINEGANLLLRQVPDRTLDFPHAVVPCSIKGYGTVRRP